MIESNKRNETNTLFIYCTSNYREKNIDEVLQIERVFTNVSKGVAASSSDIKAVFGTDDIKEVCKMVCRKKPNIVIVAYVAILIILAQWLFCCFSDYSNFLFLDTKQWRFTSIRKRKKQTNFK